MPIKATDKVNRANSRYHNRPYHQGMAPRARDEDFVRAAVEALVQAALTARADRAGASFSRGLITRGLAGVEFVVSDNHEGLKAAIRESAPRGGVAALVCAFSQERGRLRATRG
jgi:transposase-like protein